MNNYEKIALIAAGMVRRGETPENAWNAASCEVFEKGSAAQKKGCPKNAFLGLYGIRPESRNARYAQKALAYLRETHAADIPPRQLWRIVTDGEKKTYNMQMHVVLALFREGYIK
jgi:hypothetical protein